MQELSALQRGRDSAESHSVLTLSIAQMRVRCLPPGIRPGGFLLMLGGRATGIEPAVLAWGAAKSVVAS